MAINFDLNDLLAFRAVAEVQRGLTNEYFARRGLIALYEDWQKHHDRILDIGPEQLKPQTG